MTTTMPLPELTGRKVQWNASEVAEIVSAWVLTTPRTGGVTVVGYDQEVYALFRRPCGMVVTDSLKYKNLLAD